MRDGRTCCPFIIARLWNAHSVERTTQSLTHIYDNPITPRSRANVCRYIHIAAKGIYRCLILDRVEIFQISQCQERALGKRIYIINVCFPPASPLTGALQSGLHGKVTTLIAIQQTKMSFFEQVGTYRNLFIILQHKCNHDY